MRALLFDFGGTLDASGVTWKDRVRQLYRGEGIDVPPARFDPIFYAADDALVGTIPTSTPLAETVSRLVRAVSAGLGVVDDGVSDRVAATFVADVRARLARNRPLLAALGRRYRLGVVSNFYGNLETICEECGVRELFGVIVDSARVGCQKPDARIFTIALDALAVPPRDAVFVGDSLARDMIGARDVGIPHVWLVADAKRTLVPCCDDDPVIHTLEEIEALVR